MLCIVILYNMFLLEGPQAMLTACSLLLCEGLLSALLLLCHAGRHSVQFTGANIGHIGLVNSDLQATKILILKP